MCLSALLPPWSRCSDRRKSIGPSAPIAYATSVSPPNEAVAWPRCGVPANHLPRWVPPHALLARDSVDGASICAHRARCRKLISWLLDVYILEACAVICTKATLRFPMQLPLFPSTKSRFFCSRCGKDAREEVDGASGITKMTFVKLIAHSNTHCCLRRPDPSPVPGAVPKQKRTTNSCQSASKCSPTRTRTAI